MTIREIIRVALVITGIVALAALVFTLAMFLTDGAYPYSVLAVPLGSGALVGLVWSAFALTR